MLEIAIRAAREAGQVLAQKYEGPHEISVKGLRDIYTEADLAAEKVVLGIIAEQCPGARFMAEESSHTWQEHGDAPTWYVDPLDGTTNFARGLPMFSVSVAMARRDVLQCGVVYDPLLDQLFCAERGQGAYLNNRRLHVSTRSTLFDSLVMLDWPRNQAMREVGARFLARLAPQVDAVRSRGSAALGLCGVAAGWAEAYFQYTLGPWDVAAGVLIIEEAGGKVTDLRGQPYALTKPDWLATNGLVHEAVLALRPFGD
jgi:myo-inositol-1(or 4)-monophosphatase